MIVAITSSSNPIATLLQLRIFFLLVSDRRISCSTGMTIAGRTDCFGHVPQTRGQARLSYNYRRNSLEENGALPIVKSWAQERTRLTHNPRKIQTPDRGDCFFARPVERPYPANKLDVPLTLFSNSLGFRTDPTTKKNRGTWPLFRHAKPAQRLTGLAAISSSRRALMTWPFSAASLALPP